VQLKETSGNNQQPEHEEKPMWSIFILILFSMF